MKNYYLNTYKKKGYNSKLNGYDKISDISYYISDIALNWCDDLLLEIENYSDLIQDIKIFLNDNFQFSDTDKTEIFYYGNHEIFYINNCDFLKFKESLKNLLNILYYDRLETIELYYICKYDN